MLFFHFTVLLERDADGGGKTGGGLGSSWDFRDFGRRFRGRFFGGGIRQHKVARRLLVRGRHAPRSGDTPGTAACLGHVRGQPDAAFDRDRRVRFGGSRVRGCPAVLAAERHVDRRRCDSGSAFRHRPCWRQGADHHGNVFGLHWRVQFRGGLDGRRPCCLRRHHGRIDYRRSVRSRARFLLKAAASLLPVYRYGYRRPLYRLKPYQRRRQCVWRRQQRGGLRLS